MGGFAWVTLATNDSYSLGALVLAHSLKAVGTAQQLAVLVTPGVTSAMRDKLASVFNVVQEVNVLDSRDETNLRLLKRPELGITFTKLHCWRLTQYEKCVFLDADTLVLQNCDELFEREEFSAAPDVGWPDCFNSGVFVYRPSLETYEKLIQFALEKGSFDGGDQGLLNLYFSDWAHKDISKHLPFIYNMCSTACYSYLPAFKQFGANAKIIHFIGAQKPWLQYFNTETRKVQPSADSSHLQEVLQRWWNIFCSLIHPHLSPAMAGLAGAFAQLTLGVPRTAEQDAFENVLRKQAWEVGNIDYLGKDSFENIWSKITETLSSVPPQLPAAAPESAPEPEPSAPAQSQSQTALPEEEAKPIQPSVTSTVIPTDTATSTDNSKLVSTEPTPPVEVSTLPEAVPLASTEISTPPVPKEIVETKAEVIKKQVEVTAVFGGSETDASSPKILEAAKEEAGSQPEAQTIPVTPESQISEKQIEAPSVVSKSVADVSSNIPVEGKAVENIAVESQKSQQQALSTPQEKEPVVEPAVCPFPKKTEAKEETKVSDPQSVAPETPKEKESSIEVAAKSVPDKKETSILESQLPKTTETVIAPVCPLPLKEKEPKETEKQSQEASPKQAQELTKSPSSVPPQLAEPKVSPQVQETSKSEKPASTTTKDSVTLSQTSVQPTAPIPQETTASLDVTAITPSATASSTKAVIKPTLKEAPKAPESSTEVIATSPALKETIKAAPSSAPKTKITEATPPTTPSSPLVEKTKQSLAAEASIPETPPPSEGSSTPTPPPRKTDKPKKVAAKPKK